MIINVDTVIYLHIFCLRIDLLNMKTVLQTKPAKKLSTIGSIPKTMTFKKYEDKVVTSHSPLIQYIQSTEIMTSSELDIIEMLASTYYTYWGQLRSNWVTIIIV